MTCRCPICGAKNSKANTARRDYARVGMGRDERGRCWESRSKAGERRLRRRRERRDWKAEARNID